MIPGHADSITSVEFSHDYSLLLSGSFDGICRIWDIGIGQPIKMLVSESKAPISHCTFSPNSKFVLLSSLGNAIQMCDWSTGVCVKEYSGHENSKYCTRAAMSDTFIVSGSEHGANVWDLQSMKMVHSFADFNVTCVDYAFHSKTIAFGGFSPNVEIVNLSSLTT